LELNRKLITVILVILIIIVPIAAFLYVFYGPANLESISIDSVSPDFEKRDGVRVISTAQGSGADFEGKMDLEVWFDAEKISTGKVQFIDGLSNHKLFFEDFCVGNGEYEFRLKYEGLESRYEFELDVVVEELGVVSTQAYNIQNSGHQPWEALYSYQVVFKTGWHFFTHRIDRDEFASYDLGFQWKDTSAPLKVKGLDDGCRVEVFFTNPSGLQSKIHSFDVEADKTFETTIEFRNNGSYLYKYVNEKTVPITIQAYENRAVDKVPTGGSIIVTQELGAGQIKEREQLISEIDQVSGFVRPDFGPGNYTMTIDYPNPQIREGHSKSTVSFTEVIELNDKPRAIGKVNPDQISTLQRTVTFSAVDSFDDGPKDDLYVYWSFGANDEGEIGSAEGTWEDMKEVTFTYPFGEDPDVTDGKPFLILKDAYGAESSVAYINLRVS
jgi:hypothetical protein